MNWRPISQRPAEDDLFTALIAERDIDDSAPEYFLLGIYMWNGEQWLDENTMKPLDTSNPDCWWLPEQEIMFDLQTQVEA